MPPLRGLRGKRYALTRKRRRQLAGGRHERTEQATYYRNDEDGVRWKNSKDRNMGRTRGVVRFRVGEVCGAVYDATRWCCRALPRMVSQRERARPACGSLVASP